MAMPMSEGIGSCKSQPQLDFAGHGAVRSAEKARTATCLFADRVARESIAVYEARCGRERNGKQTVLAAILAHESETDSLHVLSFGVGTQV